MSVVIETAQALAPSWLTAIAVSFITLIQGTIPQDTHLTHLIVPHLDLILPRYVHTPPPNFEIWAMFSILWYIDLKSSSAFNTKQLDSWWNFLLAFINVGVAKETFWLEIASYISFTLSSLSSFFSGIAKNKATARYMYWGISLTTLFGLHRYLLFNISRVV
jgi:hypothetical protein